MNCTARLSLLGFILPVFGYTVGAQTHPYSNAWSYYTSTITGEYFSATTIAGTGGTATHVLSQVAVFMQSPNGRTASAYDYPSGTQGQVTAYLPLCGNGECEDGHFFVSTVNTTELCGQTGQTLTVPVQSGNNTVPNWIRWVSTSFEPNEIPRSNGNSTYTGRLQKSNNCSGAAASFGYWGPQGLVASFTPPSDPPQAASWTGSTGTVVWHFTTNSANETVGDVTGVAGIESTPCTVISGHYGSPPASLKVK